MNKVFSVGFDVRSAVEQTAKQGYFFAHDALDDVARQAMEAELDTLPLEVGDHIVKPINAGKPNEVRQRHARGYFEYGNSETTVANLVIDGLTRAIRPLADDFPGLSVWQPTEIGYQEYRHSNDWISPHRDRASDKLLSITFTLTGRALINIFTPRGLPDDYDNLIQTDAFESQPGSVMMLRAPGLGNGDQTIHQVMPPTVASRSIVNFRMRPTVLEQPSHPKWQ